MDTIDKKILCELDLNCRNSVSRIAKKLRTNRNVIAYRIKNLEAERIISRYICSINLGLLGYKTYKIYFKARSSKDEQQFVSHLLDSKEVISCIKTEGAFDYSVAVAVKSILELDNFLMDLKNKFREVVKDYTITIVVYSKIFKLQKLLLEQKQEIPKFEKYSGEEKQIGIDERDVKLLKELSQTANIPIVELAKRARLSVDVVRYRLKALSQVLVNSYRAMFNLSKMGYYHYVIMIRMRQAAKHDEEKLFLWCSLKKNVLYFVKKIGDFDFEINLAIKDIDELNTFLSELKTGFSEIIDSYEIIINSQLLKLNYTPF